MYNNNNAHMDFLLHTLLVLQVLFLLLLLLFSSVKNLLLNDRYNLINMPDITLQFHTVILFVTDDLHDVSYMIIYYRFKPPISPLSITTVPSAAENIPPTTTLLLYILQRHSLPLVTQFSKSYQHMSFQDPQVGGSHVTQFYHHQGSTKLKIKSMSLWQPVRHDIHTHHISRKSGNRSKI